LNEPFHSKLNIWKQIVKENETEKAVEILQFCEFFGGKRVSQITFSN